MRWLRRKLTTKARKGVLMQKNTRRPEAADKSRVNLNNPDEARYWCVRLQCSPAQLECAVRDVGTSSDAVTKHLAELWRGTGI